VTDDYGGIEILMIFIAFFLTSHAFTYYTVTIHIMLYYSLQVQFVSHLYITT